MKTKAQIFLYLLALPWNLTVAWPAVLLIRLLWGHALRWEMPPAPLPGGAVLACDLRPDSWPARTWYKPWGGTTLGHGIFYGAHVIRGGVWGRVQAHEHVHVEQFEVSMFGSAFMGMVSWSVIAELGHGGLAVLVGTLLWWAGGLLTVIGGAAVALMRGESPYRGSAHEESAYSQTDKKP